jgi:hypothetical protein
MKIRMMLVVNFIITIENGKPFLNKIKKINEEKNLNLNNLTKDIEKNVRKSLYQKMLEKRKEREGKQVAGVEKDTAALNEDNNVLNNDTSQNNNLEKKKEGIVEENIPYKAPEDKAEEVIPPKKEGEDKELFKSLNDIYTFMNGKIYFYIIKLENKKLTSNKVNIKSTFMGKLRTKDLTKK